MSEQLKECPFCGETPLSWEISNASVVSCDNHKCNLYRRGFPPIWWDKRTDSDKNLKLLMLLEAAQARLRMPPKEIRNESFRQLMNEIHDALNPK